MAVLGVAHAEVVGVLSDMSHDDGDQVVQGEVLCMVESMKVMFPAYAPCDGVVHYTVEVGDMVGEGDVLAEVCDD